MCKLLYSILYKYTYLTNKHLINKDSQPPPVHCSGIGGFSEDFWSQKFWGAAESASSISKTHPWIVDRERGHTVLCLSHQQAVLAPACKLLIKVNALKQFAIKLKLKV